MAVTGRGAFPLISSWTLRKYRGSLSPYAKAVYATDKDTSEVTVFIDWQFPATGGAGYTLTAQAGSYSITGQSATITRSRVLIAQAGSYTVTGQSATLIRSRLLVAQAGSYTFTGQSATILRSRFITAQSGSYALTGQSAVLSLGRVLTAQAGAYSLSGQDAVITYTPGTSGYVLTALAGSYDLTGQSATINVASASSTVIPIGLIPGKNTGYDRDSYMARLLGPPIAVRVRQQLEQTIEEAAQDEAPAPVVEKQVETVLTQALSNDNERQAWLAAYTEVFVSLYLTRLQEQAAERTRRQQEADDEAQAIVVALLML